MTACANCGAPLTPVVSGQTLCDKCHGLAHPEPSSPLQNAEVAGFRLVMELGAGRFAHTWLAEDSEGRPAVLKLLRRYAPDPNSVQRFLAEAQRLAGLSELDHPYVSRPVTAGVHLVSAFFLVYQSGGELTLADELRQRGRVMPARALEFCAQIAEGLAAAHRVGVLHLDLKPANIGLTKASDGTEQAVLLDVVTSHLLAGVGLRDTAPLPLSSAAYISPEEAAGKTPDVRSDFYSLGVVLFQLVSGRLPMMGANAGELIDAHRTQPPLRLRDVGRKVHADLEGLVARLLAKDPSQRPASGDEVSVLMRAIAPTADVAPMEEGPGAIEDPVLVVEGPRPDPEVMPPPLMLPPAVDPALERAMMGEVGAQPPERAPGVPGWAPFVPPRWWPGAAGGVALLGLVVFLVARAPGKHAPAAAVARPKMVATTLMAEAIAAATPAPVPVKKRAQATPGPYGKNFERAQKALWTGRPDSAKSVLHDLLRKPLSKYDRARASKMMGDAEARKGNRSAAAAWYRKSLTLFEDQDDKEKVSKLLADLR